MKSNTKGALFISLAAICWSVTGVLAKELFAADLTSFDIAFIRLFLGASMIGLYFLTNNRHLLKVSKKGLILSFFMGFLTQGLFNIAFFSAVDHIGIINATLLLYLAPVFIIFFSVLIFKEKLSFYKYLGILLALTGAFFALTGGKLHNESLSIVGLVLGTYSGFGYALVSVFCKIALKETHKETLIFYSFTFGALTIIPFVNFPNILAQSSNFSVLLLGIALGFFSAALAYIFYFKGIATQIALSKVAVISMLELIFAIFWSVLIFSEKLTPIKSMGVLAILISVIIINFSKE